ncbi:hypothetical protein EV426DRAFT_123779 [Tirmania nivea]|nr:hypothetical protein EV426DRAFT_123779 [Tirmania nivea]
MSFIRHPLQIFSNLQQSSTICTFASVFFQVHYTSPSASLRYLSTSATLVEESDKEMGDEPQKKRRFPWKTSYSDNFRKDVIGTTIKHPHSTAIIVQEMLALAGYQQDSDVVKKIKDKVYSGVVRCLRVEGHETLTEPNANDLAMFIIIPTIDEFIEQTGRDRGKKVVSVDGETGGYEEFVVIVYGFITTGVVWRMLRYDAGDGSFLVSNRIEAVFDTMRRERERWIRDFSVIVDCVYAALGDRGR